MFNRNDHERGEASSLGRKRLHNEDESGMLLKICDWPVGYWNKLGIEVEWNHRGFNIGVELYEKRFTGSTMDGIVQYKFSPECARTLHV